ncbi:MAG: hypothetical protein A2231_09850 [Candidatus Firestonebacteria bacterium RIFOXYA2_FULL_40_8]|nr:MAG: hypothetical protein A2231_09850 [Candidatus Firestonebacteria bacterium RIFOXYA2_FULL_40_8]
MKNKWLYISKSDLEIELEQLKDEGREISKVLPKFKKLLKVKDEMKYQVEFGALLDETIMLPMRKNYKYLEPSDLNGIKKARPSCRFKKQRKLTIKKEFDIIYGAWLGRCAGCLLGKPVEGIKRGSLEEYLTGIDNFPLKNYIKSVPKMLKKVKWYDTPSFIDKVDRMVEDDDTNYTVTGLVVMKNHGKDFKSEDVANFWMQNIPLLHTCTAERVAYRNFAIKIQPPASATYRNAYREWIGAQIRADFFGYVALGDPEKAAEYAFRDASISHVKNGIYGEMWVAAMLAAAPYYDDPKDVINAGLNEIPKNCRLTEDIKKVINWYFEGINYSEAIDRIHKLWDEKSRHHWVHTNSNAQIVAMGLLFSEMDFEKSVCRAVEAAFDTDCNGATVGSIMGMMLGAKKLPKKWTGPLHDTLETGIAGYHLVKISDLAKETLKIRKINERI